MTFNIRQLDNLTYDEVEPILGDYIQGAIDQFVNSPEGQAYVESHPTGGGWIGTFIEMAYLYDGITLPKMTKGSVQGLMEYILPRKITIFDPAEAEDAIPELMAFWQFLQREYKFRSANAILKYLATLESKFPTMMCDPNRGGMAKAFVMMGHQSGFDMTTPEGIQAFQEQYNASLQSGPPDLIAQAIENMMGGRSMPPSSQPPQPKPKGMEGRNTTSAKKTTGKKASRKKQ
jgi:hypothetical protein